MFQCQPHRKPLIAAAFAALTALSIPATAGADGSVWTAAHLANLTTLRRGGVIGLGGQLGVNVDLSQYFALTGDVGFSHHFPNEKDEIPGDRVAAVAGGLRYNFDVFKYVPYAGLAVAGYLDAPLVDGANSQVNAGAKLFLGVDWRFHRYWSVGFRGELHSLLTDLSRFPVYTLVGGSFAYHFRL